MPIDPQSAIPIPGVNTQDPAGNASDPTQRLLELMRGAGQPAVGTIAPGVSMPPPSLHQMQPVPGVPQAKSYATKGENQRASMQNLGAQLNQTVAIASNALAQHENKIMEQKTDAYTRATSGIQQANEILKNDPTNAEALNMLATNKSFLESFLNPHTPEGKKNIKFLEKAYPETQPEETTPEQQAAQRSAKKLKSQTDYETMAKTFQHQSGMPQTAQMSPMTQAYAQMVKAGVVPKAATGGQVLASETQAAKAAQASEDKQKALDVKQEMQDTRLGNDPKTHKPLPLDQLPPSVRVRVESERASDNLKSAQAALAQAKEAALKDPNSTANQLALGRLGAMNKFAAARMLQAQASMLGQMAGVYGEGLDKQPVPNALVINGQVTGQRFAGAAVKAMQTQAQFIDADGAVDNLTAAAKALHDKGGKLNDPRLVKLMTDNHFKDTDNQAAFNNWIGGQVGSTLSPEQRDYLVAQKQARENIMAIRKVIGTGVSVKAMEAITSTLPGAQTPDYDYANRQIQAVKGQLNRLQQGVPQIYNPNRTNQPGAQPGQQTPGKSDKLTNDLNEALKF